MPDLCFYAPWIMKEPIPDPFRMMLEKAGKKRVSYDEADCSMRNIRKQGKVSRLHGPTLHALLTLIQIRKEKDSGAAGIQRGRDTINYFCMEYPGNQGKYVMTYNSKNGRFSGILKTEEKNEKLPGIREGKNTGEQYLALLAYANLVPDNPLFNEEFQKNFYILEEQEKKEWEDKEAALRAAFICCDAMYCEVIANPQQAIPLEKSQFRAEELEDVLPEYKIAAGVYAPNDEIYGKFHVLLPVNEKTKRTLFELKQIYSGRWDVNERTKERIPSLPEDYLVSNPLDCLCYYPNWKNSVYYIVDASGDLDEDGEDSKISCTKMRLLKKIELRSLLLHGAAYMAKYPNRKWNSHVAKENGTSCNGFCIVRGKDPKAKGQKGDLLLLLKEQPDNSQILEIGVICVDGQKYPEETWLDVAGEQVEL